MGRDKYLSKKQIYAKYGEHKIVSRSGNNKSNKSKGVIRHTKIIHKQSKPRLTAHGQGNLNVNANAPTTRMGWLYAVIGIIILIVVLPWLLVQSAALSVGSGVDTLTQWIQAHLNSVVPTWQRWISDWSQPALGRDWLYNLNSWFADWIDSWKWW